MSAVCPESEIERGNRPLVDADVRGNRYPQRQYLQGMPLLMFHSLGRANRGGDPECRNLPRRETFTTRES